MKRPLFFAIVAMLSAAGSFTSAARAVVLNSQSFSLGYGFSHISGSKWDDSETASVNTATTLGNFSFTPAPKGDRFSGDGVVFTNRVLMDQSADGVSGNLTEAFEVPITAVYSGSAPSGVAEPPNYRLRLEITKISIYGGEHSSSASSIPLEWIETTPGHETVGPNMALPITNDFNEAASYSKVEWDPVDFEFTLANLNDPVMRTFDIPAFENEGDLRFIDGLEIEGRVSLIYDGTAPVLLGDYNNDGRIDAADYTTWRDNPASLQNEGASPGTVDIADYNFWKMHFGETSGTGALGIQAPVPEPTASLYLLVGLLGFATQRFRRWFECAPR